MQAIQVIDGEALALGKRLLASSWCSPLLELQSEPPNGRRKMHVQPGLGDGRDILHFDQCSGLFRFAHRLVERGAHQLGSAAPEAIPTECLWCGAWHGLRARIGIHNGIGIIEKKEGTGRRLNHGEERLTRHRSVTFGLLWIRHSVGTIPFSVPTPSRRTSFPPLTSRPLLK